MPWATNDVNRITDQLNFAWNEVVQSLGANAYPGYLNFGSTLSPAEYTANQPQPINFTISQIQTKMNAITNEYAITQVQKMLTDLEVIDTAKATAIGSQNYALVRADQLEWDVRFKTQGFEERRSSLIERLRYSLNLPPTPQPQNSGGIIRS